MRRYELHNRAEWRRVINGAIKRRIMGGLTRQDEQSVLRAATDLNGTC